MGEGADFAHCGAVAENINLFESHRLARFDCRSHGGLVFALDSDDMDVGKVNLQPTRGGGSHAAASHLQVDNIERALARHHNLVGQGALACHHCEVVVGVDVGEAFSSSTLVSRGAGAIVAVTVESNLHLVAAVPFDCDLLHPWRGQRHVNDRLSGQLARG